MTNQTAPLAQQLAAVRKAIEAERPTSARALLRTLTKSSPNSAEAWLQLARSESMLENAGAARLAFERCLTLAPKEPILWMELAISESRHGQGNQILKRARKAGLPQALLKMLQTAAKGQGAKAQGTGGATRADLAALGKAAAGGNLRAVETRAAPILKARAGAVIWGIVAQARADAGKFASAAEAFRQGIVLEPYAVDLRLGLVHSLAMETEVVKALVEARRAAQIAPRLTSAQLVYGRIVLQAGLADRAMAIAEQALRVDPNSDAVLALAAETAMQVGRHRDAIDYARRRSKASTEYDILLARTLSTDGQLDESLAVYDALIARHPTDAAALAGRGQLRQTLGDMTAAEADLRAAMAADPTEGSAARALAYGTKLSEDDPAVIVMKDVLAREEIGPQLRRQLDYALARVLQSSDPAAAAAHLASANASMLRTFPYDVRQLRERQETSTDREWPILRAALASGVRSTSEAAPIFVTGLPRSGTTLVEAIISAHPRVAAGGELGVVRRSIMPLARLLAEGGTPTEADLTAAGDAYADAACHAAGQTPDGHHLTDKSIFTFMDIGLIQAILPRAKVVVVTRDPRDMGLSIWRNHFREGTHRYAASQPAIADQVEMFRDAMNIWQRDLPDAYHRIDYDALLQNPEEQVRALLEYLDLEWNERVMSFNEHAGRVQTLSFAQVRQPLYKSSSGGWKRSAEEIAELIAALDAKGLLPPD